MNEFDKLDELLRENSRNVATNSAFKKFEKLLARIEESFNSGRSHADILKDLNAGGFILSLNTYRVYLKRARRRANKGSGAEKKNISPQPTIVSIQNDKSSGAAAVSPLIERVRDGIPDPPFIDWRPGQKLGKDW